MWTNCVYLLLFAEEENPLQMPFPLHIPCCCYLWVNGLWKMEAEIKILLCQSLGKLELSAAHLSILSSPRLPADFCHCPINLIHFPSLSTLRVGIIPNIKTNTSKNSFLQRSLDKKSLQELPRLGFVSPEGKEGSQTKLSLQGREWSSEQWRLYPSISPTAE